MSEFAESAATAASAMQGASAAGSDAGSSWKKASDGASEAGSSFGDLAATTVGVSAGLESAADDADVAEGGVSDLSQAADRAKEALGAMGLAAGATGLVAFFQDAVMAASDLQESTNVVDTLFGDSADQIYQFAEGASSALGVANISAREAAGTFGIYGKQANLAADENAKFSIKMSTLAADMASFRNTSPEQAIQAIGAAFRGESDPIEAYGVILNETILKNRAMAEGLIDNTADALTPAVRVQVAYNEVLQQTSYMQGDFTKTSGSLSNQLKSLKADFLNQSAAIGGELLPIASSLVSLIAGPGMSAFEGFGSVLGQVGDAVAYLGGVFGNLPAPIQAIIGGLVAMRIAAMLAGSSMGQALAARVTAAGTSMRNFVTGPVGGVTAGLSAMRTQFGYAQQAFRNTNGGVQTLGGTLRSVGTVGMSAFAGAARGLVGFLGGPWGVALAAATVAVGLFMKSNGEAKQRLSQVRSSVEEVAQALDKSGGKYTEAGVKAAASALEQVKLRDGVTTLGSSLEDLGVSSDVAAQGLAGSGTAMRQTREELERLAAEEKARNRENIDNSLNPWTGLKNTLNIGGFRDEANQAQNALRDVTAMQEAIEVQQASLRRVAEAGGDVVFSDSGVAAMGAMATAMEEFSTSTDGAATRVKVLSGALAGLQGDALTVDDAMQGWNDTIRELGADTSGFVGLIDPATGSINSLTEANSKAYDTAKATALSLKDVAAATYESTGSYEAVRAAIAPLYGEFERMMQAAGMPQPEIDALAAKLGMLPTDITLSLMADDYPHATELAKILGNSIIDVPDDKSIHVQSNSPEIAEQVRALGLKVETLPDGTIRILANTEEASAQMDAWERAQAARTVYKNLRVIETRENTSGFTPGRIGSTSGQANGGIIRQYADGGLSPMSGRQATVVPPNTWRVVGDRARDDEFFIPDTDEPQHVSLGAEWARRRGLALVDKKSLSDMYGAALYADGGISAGELTSQSQSIEGAQYVWGGWDGTWNTDCSGAGSRLANMAVYGDPDAAGRFATGNAREALTARGFADGYRDGALNIGWKNGGPGGGHMASTLPNGTNVEMGGARGDGQFGGTAGGAADFPDVMHYVVQGDPSASEVGSSSPSDASSTTSSGGGLSDSGTSSDSGTDGARVFVTNWPGQAQAEEKTPRARLTASFFADGGTVPGVGDGDTVPAWLTPEEEVTRKPMAKKYRSLLKLIDTDSVPGFANGGTVGEGFGGYSGPDTDDYMKPNNLYEAASLAAGVGFTALSGISNYAGMAASGTVDLSKLAPSFDTGSNDIPGLSEAFSKLVEPLNEILETLKKGGTIDAQINVDSETGRVQSQLLTSGIA